MDIRTEADSICSTLIAAGLHTTFEPARVELPGALLHVKEIRFENLDAKVTTVDWEIYLLTQAEDSTVETFAKLEAMATILQKTYPIPSLEPVIIPLQHYGSVPIPGLMAELTSIY